MRMSNYKSCFLVFILLFSHSIWACTSYLVGKDATINGSTLISYSADSYLLYGYLNYLPASRFSDSSMLEIRNWETGKYQGKIKQVPQTYSVVGNMNEYQLSIAESTFEGRKELIDSTGILDYGNLIYLALQRAKNAREAIQTITSLVNEYGYSSSGESFSIADPNEVWILEMIGKGTYNKGAVWVAQRIPDDCISGHANQARISKIQLEDSINCIHSEDVISFARESGYFNGLNAEFSFCDVYNPLTPGTLRLCEARVWTFFRKFHPDMDKYLNVIKADSVGRMPLWIKPSKKISSQNLKNCMRDQYQGTELDMSKGFAAGAFGSKLRCSPLEFQIDSVHYAHNRPVATQQTGFSFVAEMRNWLPNYVGGILWFGVDDAASNLYVPMFCGINGAPQCFSSKNGSLLEYSATSAFWTYNWVANFAYTKYSYILPEIIKVQKHWEDSFISSAADLEKKINGMNETEARKILTEFSHIQADSSTVAWRKFGEYLFVKYMDGVIKLDKNGKFVKNEMDIPPSVMRVGYSDDFLRKLVKENPELRIKSEGK